MVKNARVEERESNLFGWCDVSCLCSFCLLALLCIRLEELSGRARTPKRAGGIFVERPINLQWRCPEPGTLK